MPIVIYFENSNSPIGNSVTSLSPNFKGDIIDAAIQAIKEQGLPVNTPYQIVQDALEPIFKEARKVENGKLVADIGKSKLIAHGMRRAKRSIEFMPLDGDNLNVLVTPETEAQRVIVRDKYAGIQIAFNNVNNVKALKGLMKAQGWV